MFFKEVIVESLNVRILNHQNRTSIAQVMVHFPRMPHVRLFICLRPDLGLISELSLELSYGFDMALFLVCVWLVLWPNYGLVVDSLWTESEIALCLVGGIIV